MSKTGIPSIRFRGFDDAWEQRKLGKLVDVCSGRDYKHLSEGTIPVYGTGGYMLSVNDALSYDRDAIGIGRKGTIDKPYILKAPFWTVDTLFYAIPREKVDLNFAFDIFQNIDWKKKDESTGVPSLSKTAINDIDVLAPKHGEQQTIGQFFAGIDHLITLHQRKFEKLTNVKKSMLEKMFPQNGSSYPEIRFKGFTDPWEQRKLGEIGSVSMCRRIFKEQTSETGDIPFYKIGTFGVEPDAFISRELFEEYKSKYPYPKKGDILISASGSIGRTVEFAGNDEYFQDSNIVWLSHDERLSNPFLKCFYSVVKWAGIEGSTIKRLYNDNILNTVICMPSVPEQECIGAFFENLDNLITLHQRKCALLFSPFQALISMMFTTSTFSWEQRKFDEVFDCTVPNNTLSRAELSYDEGTVLNVHYGDVLIKYGSVLDVQKDDIPRIPHRCREDFNGALLQDGDVIIADTAEDETTGKACEIGNLQGSAIVSGLHTMVCRPRNRMALGYLGYYLNSNAYHHQLLPLMQGIKVLSLSRSNIQKTSVSYPSAVKEQQLIASYFIQLDNLITLHQRKPFLMKWRTSDANRNQTNRLVL